MYDENWTQEPSADDPLPFDDAHDTSHPLQDEAKEFGGVPDGAENGSPLRTDFEDTQPAPDLEASEAEERLEDMMEKEALKDPAPRGDGGRGRDRSQLL